MKASKLFALVLLAVSTAGAKQPLYEKSPVPPDHPVFYSQNYATLQLLSDAVPSAGGTMIIAPGTYTVSAVVTLKSNTTVECLPGATLKMTDASQVVANHYIFANVNYTASTLTDSNIKVRNCAFDGNATTPSTGADAIRFVFASSVEVTGNTFTSFGDATAFLGTFKSLEANNRATNITNACWDHWYAGSYISITNNYCETKKHGIEVTGTNTAQNDAGIASHVTIRDNDIVLYSAAATGAGIWLNAGASSDTGAGVSDTTITGGHISTSGLGASVGDCIKISGSGSTNDWVIGVHCDNGLIYVGPADALATSYPSNIHILGAQVNITNTLADGAIQIKTGTSGVSNSRVTGAGYAYCFNLIGATHQYARHNSCVSGTDGTTPRLHTDGTSAATALIIDPDETGAAPTLTESMATYNSVSYRSPQFILGTNSNGYVQYAGSNKVTLDETDASTGTICLRTDSGAGLADRLCLKNGGDITNGPLSTTHLSTAFGDGALALRPATNNNTAFGYQALNVLTTGSDETAFGKLALRDDVDGQFNTALGSAALRCFTGTGSKIGNTAVGHGAMGGDDTLCATTVGGSPNTGGGNTAIGAWSMQELTTAVFNIAIGDSAGLNLTTGGSNVIVGSYAGCADTTFDTAGTPCAAMANGVAVGFHALRFNQSASMVAVGYEALGANTSGTLNTALGFQALSTATTDVGNTALGYDALLTQNTSSGFNTAIGANAGKLLTTGTLDTYVGYNAGATQTIGNSNTGIGAAALTAYTGASGGGNTAVGDHAGASITSGPSNTILGSNVGSSTLTTGTGNILIGVSSYTTTAASSTSNTLQITGLSPGTSTVSATGINSSTPIVTLGGDFTVNFGTGQTRLGAADAAVPVAQVLSVQGSRSGTDTDTAGANLTIRSGMGTGSATGSTITLSPALATSTGTTAQTPLAQITVGTTAISIGSANNPTITLVGSGALSGTPLTNYMASPGPIGSTAPNSGAFTTLTSSSGIALTSLATQATNTVVGNSTSGTAAPTALAVGTCSTAASALKWTTNTGFGCNTAIDAATLGTATFSAPGAIGGGTPAPGTFTNLNISGAGTGNVPYVLFQWGIPVMVPSGGSFANNGALTPTIALPNNAACSSTTGCYMYFPVNVIAAGVAAGTYFTRCSSTTACTVYNNLLSSGTPTSPASPTAFSVTGPGAYTQTVASDLALLTLTIPANSMGPNGSVLIMTQWQRVSNASTLNMKYAIAGAGVGTVSNASTQWLGYTRTVRNLGIATAQAVQNGSTVTDQGAVNGAPTYTAIDTTIARNLVITANIATSATDWAICLGGSVVVSYAP